MTATTSTPQPAKPARKPRRDWKPTFLHALENEGTVWAACVTANISRATAYRARQADETFALAWADVEHKVTDQLERKAVSLALNGDTRMLEFLLKARKPQTYTERRQVEHTGTVKHDLRRLPDSELEAIANGIGRKRATTT